MHQPHLFTAKLEEMEELSFQSGADWFSTILDLPFDSARRIKNCQIQTKGDEE